MTYKNREHLYTYRKWSNGMEHGHIRTKSNHMYVGSDQMAWKHGHIKTESGHIHIGSDQMVWSMAIYMDHSAKTDDHPITRGTL